MKTKTLLSTVIISGLIFSACSLQLTQTPDAVVDVLRVNLEDDYYEVTFNINRLDSPYKDSSEFENMQDAPDVIKVTNLNVDSNDCNIARTPYTCYYENDLDESVQTQNLNIHIEFEDGLIVDKQVQIPNVTKIDGAEILLPELSSEDKSILEFQDIGLDKYLVTLNACYADSCLESEYNFEKIDGQWTIDQDPLDYYAEIITAAKNIKVDFEFEPELYKKLSYTVNATQGEVKIMGINIQRASNTHKTFEF